MKKPDFDAVVVGAGVTGMYQLYKLREAGLSVKGIEGSANVGGSWYLNRYPGCRVDSESYTYCYYWSEELLQNFNWTEKFASQPEVLKYLNTAADVMDIRKDYMFNTRVKQATWDAKNKFWKIELLEGGAAPLTARMFITAVGPLSALQMPKIDGVHTFKGEWHHTGRWPRDPDSFGGAPVDFKGKRVAVVGTGASGIQVIQEAAKVAKELVVFQRSPNWATPLGNAPISPAEMEKIKKNYKAKNEFCNTTLSGFEHKWIDKETREVSAEEREATFERLYKGPGFSLWLANFKDILYNQEANDLVTEFVARKIRQRVKDPKIAEKLIPKDHGYGLRRVPLETNYYEVYNQDNVRLVDLKETPIDRVTPDGIRTTEREYEFDIIVYATGFDAIVGSISRMEVVGEDGVSLKQAWKEGIKTYLGLMICGFPNFFTLVGPQNGTVLSNLPRCSADATEWFTDMLVHARNQGAEVIIPTPVGQEQWNDLCYEKLNHSLLGKTGSWFTGVNKNIEGRNKPVALLYAGGNPAWRELCRRIAENGYEGFVFLDVNGNPIPGHKAISARVKAFEQDTAAH